MSFSLPLSRFDVRAVEKKIVTPQERTQVLNFRVPKSKGFNTRQLYRELSGFVDRANQARSEAEPAWSLSCVRTGRNFKAVCTQTLR